MSLSWTFSNYDDLYGPEFEPDDLSVQFNFSIDDVDLSILEVTGLATYFDVKAWATSAAVEAQLEEGGLSIVSYGKGEKTNTITWDDLADQANDYVISLTPAVGETISIIVDTTSDANEVSRAFAEAFANHNAVGSKYFTVATDANDNLLFTANSKGSNKSSVAVSLSAKVLSGTDALGTNIAFTDSFTAEQTESTDDAWVRFVADATGAAGVATIAFSGDYDTLLTISGVDDGDRIYGDDEFYTAPVTGVTATAVTDTRVNNITYIQ